MSNFKAWNYDDDQIVGWDSANVNSAYNNQVSGIIKFAEDLACEKVGNLEARLKAGLVISAGILGKIPKGQTESLSFKSLNDGQSRIDMVCFKTYKENGRIVGDIVIVEGAASSGVAVEPTIVKGDLELGLVENYTPLYRVSLNGPNIKSIDLISKLIKHNLDELISNMDNKADKTYVDNQDLKNLSLIKFDEEKIIINDNINKKLSLTGGVMTGTITTDIGLPLTSGTLVHKTYVDDELKKKVDSITYNSKISDLETKDKSIDSEITLLKNADTTLSNSISGKVDKKGDVMSGALQLPPANPSGDYIATHKTYVDNQDAKKVDLTTYNTKIAALETKNSTQDTDISNRTTKTYVDQEILKQVSKNGDTMSGMLVLSSTNPTLGTHATNKAYVDSRDALKADLTYVDTELTKKIDSTLATNWQKHKISNDNGQGYAIPPNTTWSQYFQLNNNVLKHFTSEKKNNSDAPDISIDGIAGNNGNVSTANPSGLFWALGLNSAGQLFGTHSKGDNSTQVTWQRYIDTRDFLAAQVYKITENNGYPKAGLNDYNLLVSTGVYYQSTTINAPESGDFLLEVINNNNTVFQRATSVATGENYWRVKNGDNWPIKWEKGKSSIDDEWIQVYDSAIGIAVGKYIPTTLDISLYQDIMIFQVGVNLGIPMYPRRDKFSQYYGVSGYDAVSGFVHTEVTVSRVTAATVTVDKSTYYTANYGTTNSGRTQPNIGSVYVRNKIY